MYKALRIWLCKKFGWHQDGLYLYFNNRTEEPICHWCNQRITRKCLLRNREKWKINEN